MASLTVTFTHSALSVERSITVDDAKLIEFADLLRAHHYPLDEEGNQISRQAAIRQFADGMIAAAKDTYKRYKRQENVAAVPEPPEMDA